MVTKRVEIGGKILALRYNFAGLYLFEEVAGQAFDARKLWHRHLLYWCMLRANNREAFETDFDGFVELLNGDPGLSARLDAAFAEIVAERASSVRSADGGPADGLSEEKKRAGGS